jgi:WD40 repeat protein
VRPRPRRRWRTAAGILAALVAAVLVTAVVAHFRTDRGDVVLQTDGGNVEVVARKNGDIVRIRDLGTGRTWELEEKQLNLRRADDADGLRIEVDGRDPFVLKRRHGRLVAINVPSKQPPDITPPRDPDAITEVRRFEEGFSEVVWAVSVSADGRYGLITGGPNRIWDLSTGEVVRGVGYGGWIAGLSPDGKYALTGDASAVGAILWELPAGKAVRVLTPETRRRVRNAVFSPDSRWVAVNHAGTVCVWETATGNAVQTVTAYGDANHSAVFSPDGKHLLVLRPGNRLTLYETGTWKDVRELTPTLPGVTDFAFSADGRHCLCGSNRSPDVCVYDLENGAEVKRLHGPGEGINCVVVSPDGRRVVVSTPEKMVLLWDLASGQEVTRYNSGLSLLSLAFAPNGRYVLAGAWEKKAVYLRLPEPPEKDGLVRTFVGHTQQVMNVQFARGGSRVVSAGFDRTVRVWETDTGNQVHCFTDHTDYICGLAVSPDGERVLSGSHDRSARLWDLVTGASLGKIPASLPATDAVDFAPGGNQALIGGYDGMLRLFDLTTFKQVRLLEGHQPGSNVRGVAFSADGKRAVSCGGDRTVRMWDVASGTELFCCKGHTDMVHSVAYSRDGRHVLSGGWDGIVCLWDAHTGKEIRRFASDPRSVDAVAISRDGRRAFWSKGGRLTLADIPTGKEITSFEHSKTRVLAVAFSPDGRYALSGGDDRMVRLWRLPDPPPDGLAEECRLVGHSGLVTCLAVTPDGRHAFSAGADRVIRKWEVASGKEVLRLEGHTGTVRSLAVSPDGRQLLSGSDDGTIRLWKPDEDTKEQGRMIGVTDPCWGMTWTADGRRALCCSESRGVRLFDVTTKREVRRFSDGWANTVAVFDPSRLVLSGGSEGRLLLRNLDDGATVRRLEGHVNWVRTVAFSADGRLAVSGGGAQRFADVDFVASNDSIAIIWDTETGRALHRLTGHRGTVYGARFTPDESHVVTSGNDGTIRLWDVKTGKEVGSAEVGAAVGALAVLPDGRHALLAASDGTLRLWRLPAPPPGLVRRVSLWDARQTKEANVFDTRFSPDGRYYLGSGDSGPSSGIRVWEVESGRQVVEFFTGKEVWYCQGAIFLPDGRHVLSCYKEDSRLFLWEVATGNLVRTFEGHGANNVWLGDVSADGRRAVSWGIDRTLRVWDLATGKQLQQFPGTGDDKMRAVFSPDGGRVLSNDAGNVLHVWDVQTGKEQARMSGHTGWCNGCFTPDGRGVVSWSADSSVRSWDATATAKERWKSEHPGGVSTASVTPDGLRVVSAGSKDRTVFFQDLQTGRRLRQMQFEGDLARIDPNGRFLLTTYNEVGPVFGYDLFTGKELFRDSENAKPRSLSFSPDGRFAAAGSFRRGIYLYRLPPSP